jgi:PAS domain S-box-containing protein
MTRQKIIQEIEAVEGRLRSLIQRLDPSADDEPSMEAVLEDLSIGLEALDGIQRGLLQPEEGPSTERIDVALRLKRSLAERQKRESEMRCLLEASRAIMESHRFEEAARRVFDAAREVTGAVSGYVALLSEDGAENEVLFLESGGLACEVDPELPMPVRGLRAIAYERAAVVYENDFENSEWVEFMPPGHVAMRNVLFAPLTIDDQVVGVIGLANKPGGFNADDVRITQALGDLAALALDRVWAEEAVRESEERYQTILRTIEDGYFEIDLAGNFTFFNDAMIRIIGYPEDEMKGMNYRVYMGESVADHVYRTFNQVYRTGRSNKGFDWKLTRKDGSGCWVSVSVVLIRDSAGEAIGFRGIARDVTARKRAEAALQASEEKYRGLVEQSLQGMVIAQDNPVRVVFASNPMEEIIGFSPQELVSFGPQQLAGMIHPQHRETFFQNFRARIRGEEVSPRRDYQIIHRSGEARWVEIYSSRIEYEGEPATQTVFLDITARKAAEAKLQEYAHLLEEMVEDKVRQLERERAKIIQMDKMAALGQLATGVAHELNQPLTAITFEADYLRRIAEKVVDGSCDLRDVLPADQLDKIGADVLGDLARCRRIIDHMREFSRLSQGCPRSTDINQVIEDSFIFVRQRLRHHNIDVRFSLSPNLPLILVDPHRLEQVFLNLIANAEYALEQRSEEDTGTEYRKTLEIATHSRDGWVMAMVQDNGSGIPEDVQKRIFDPFFTTKPVGEGTGLGLSISYGIVTEYGGEIACHSTEGEGTRFTLRFPVSEPSSRTGGHR